MQDHQRHVAKASGREEGAMLIRGKLQADKQMRVHLGLSWRISLDMSFCSTATISVFLDDPKTAKG